MRSSLRQSNTKQSCELFNSKFIILNFNIHKIDFDQMTLTK